MIDFLCYNQNILLLQKQRVLWTDYQNVWTSSGKENHLRRQSGKQNPGWKGGIVSFGGYPCKVPCFVIGQLLKTFRLSLTTLQRLKFRGNLPTAPETSTGGRNSLQSYPIRVFGKFILVPLIFKRES